MAPPLANYDEFKAFMEERGIRAMREYIPPGVDEETGEPNGDFWTVVISKEQTLPDGRHLRAPPRHGREHHGLEAGMGDAGRPAGEVTSVRRGGRDRRQEAMAVELLFLAWNRLEFTSRSWAWLVAHTNWELVSKVVVYDDDSTDGTDFWLSEQIVALNRAGEHPPIEMRHTQLQVRWRSCSTTSRHRHRVVREDRQRRRRSPGLARRDARRHAPAPRARASRAWKRA